MKWVWERLKIGVVPLIILGIPFSIGMYIWGILNPLIETWGLHPFNMAWADVALNILLAVLFCMAIGEMLLRPKSQEFFKECLPGLPLIGPFLLHGLVPKEDLKLVEIQTYEGNWEFALCLHKWSSQDLVWYRVHTLGFGSGRLFSRVSSRNIAPIPDSKQHDAWAVILSMGLLSGEKKDK